MRKSEHEKDLEDIVETFLADGFWSFEELLEKFNITPTEAFITLYNAGDIDEDILDSLRSS
jgi:hypothetical protein